MAESSVASVMNRPAGVSVKPEPDSLNDPLTAALLTTSTLAPPLASSSGQPLLSPMDASTPVAAAVAATTATVETDETASASSNTNHLQIHPSIPSSNNGMALINNISIKSSVLLPYPVPQPLENGLAVPTAMVDPPSTLQHMTASPSPEEGEEQDDMEGSGGDDKGTEEEDVWPEDVETAFQEAMQIYPPIGRRKLLENGKMYGRNELIARHIFKRTTKQRSRKQVSSHIQVLNKKSRKLNDQQFRSPSVPLLRSPGGTSVGSPGHSSHTVGTHNGTSFRPHQNQLTLASSSYGGDLSSLGPMQIWHPNAYQQQQHQQALFNSSGNHHPGFITHPPTLFGSSDKAALETAALVQQQQNAYISRYLMGSHNHQPANSIAHPAEVAVPVRAPQTLPRLRVLMLSLTAYADADPQLPPTDLARHAYVNLPRELATKCFTSIDLPTVAFGEIHDKFNGLGELINGKNLYAPFYLLKLWVNPHSEVLPTSIHTLNAQYESRERFTLKCTTLVSSFGKRVVEKSSVVEGVLLESGAYFYNFNQTPLCEYFVHFVNRLKQLGSIEMMDKVLENFTVMNVVQNVENDEVMFCTPMVFCTSPSTDMSCHIFRLSHRS